VLTIGGQKVTYDKSMDIPSALNPYNIDITPDGKYVIASNTGAQKNNADAEVIIEATGPHPHVIDLMTPGIGPEGFAIAPDGKTAAAPLLLGSGAKESDWFRTKGGELVLMSIGAGGKLTVTARARLGGIPEGVVDSPKSDYVYVGNYVDKDVQVFQFAPRQTNRSGAQTEAARPAGLHACFGAVSPPAGSSPQMELSNAAPYSDTFFSASSDASALRISSSAPS
jgi:DNA-binding beta-propeller fold protein YncE